MVERDSKFELAAAHRLLLILVSAEGQNLSVEEAPRLPFRRLQWSLRWRRFDGEEGAARQRLVEGGHCR